MKIFLTIPYVALVMLPLLGRGQQAQVREQRIPSDATASHLFLQVHVPGGELYLQQSGTCGTAVSRVFASDTSCKWMQTRKIEPRTRNVHQTLTLHHVGMAASAAPSAPSANLRETYRVDPTVSDQLARAVRSEFRPDPSISTDLNLHLGRGSSLLDLSQLTLHNLNIESAFSDLVITYSQPNQATMQQMHVHAANATVVLKHLEMSRAKLVKVQNDMGDTKIMLGPTLPGVAEVTVMELQNGVGDCLIVVDNQHPVRVIVTKGVLASVSASPEVGFHQLQGATQLTYQNQAASRLPESRVTTIHAHLDFGKLTLISR